VVDPSETDAMTIFRNLLGLEVDIRKILSYYLGYNLIFLIGYIAFISMISFFHFLLEHDMAVIENWIFRNAWEVIVFSKLLASFIIIKALKLNNYFTISLWQTIKEEHWKPSRYAVIFILFISFLFYALIMQFSGELINNAKDTDFAHISFLGSAFFYFMDFFIINLLLKYIPISNQRKLFVLLAICLVFFLFFTKATLPYINKYYIFLILHFVTLLIFLAKEPKNLLNPILYALIVIGPFSSFYGLDLVWDNAHSIYSYKETLPNIGILGLWLIGLVYYFKAQ
jgi:hypothetical protein